LWLAGLSEQPVRYMYFVLRLGGKGGREAHATCVFTATTPHAKVFRHREYHRVPLLPGTGEDLRFIHLDPANVDQSR
jgi:hypothetical protein